MPYRSEAWGVDVRDEVAQEWARADGTIDDNMAGLHEVRRRISEETAGLTPQEKAAFYNAQAEAQQLLEPRPRPAEVPARP